MLGISHVYKLHPCVALHYYSLFALQLTYPIMIAESLIAGEFWSLAVSHLFVLAALGALYSFEARRLPAEERVHPLWFMSLGIVMPVTYVVHNALALFTLDSGSWETRQPVQTSEKARGLGHAVIGR
jgi:hypothetical protein